MRCVLRFVTHSAGCALAIAILLMGSATAASAQSFVCYSIHRNETAPQVARRLTGDSRNAYQTWFQIRNASSRFVPKSQYNRLRPDWQACLLKPIVQRASAKLDEVIASKPLAPSAVPGSVRSESPAARASLEPAVLVSRQAGQAQQGLHAVALEVLRAIGGLDLSMVWLGAVMVVPWVGWRLIDEHRVRRKTRTIVMKHYATRFVQEFERPLIWSEGDRPLRSRVRYSARRGRIDVLLAPGKGRRYPNLSDHKKNVEYDVARVVRAVADPAFVNGRLYTQGGWVVVPFEFRTGPHQPGATCISSF